MDVFQQPGKTWPPDSRRLFTDPLSLLRNGPSLPYAARSFLPLFRARLFACQQRARWASEPGGLPWEADQRPDRESIPWHEGSQTPFAAIFYPDVRAMWIPFEQATGYILTGKERSHAGIFSRGPAGMAPVAARECLAWHLLKCEVIRSQKQSKRS